MVADNIGAAAKALETDNTAGGAETAAAEDTAGGMADIDHR